MKINSILGSIKIKNKIIASVCGLSLALGTMLVLDKNNIDLIKEEQSIISEMTNKTLNISFMPNNPDMKDNVNLFNPITDSDIANIEKIQGVKSVKPINAEYNPLAGYAKVNNESSYIELYGFAEAGNDINKDKIEMLYGRNISSNDVGKNVIVLNMETVNSMKITNAKDLLGTGLEINGSVYEIIGIMNTVIVDERDNNNELEFSSLIPKSTSKEIISRANSRVGVYGSISVQLQDGYNINAVESSIYNLLYQSHENISGYYERDSEYSLPKKLGPTMLLLDNFIKTYNVVTYVLLSLAIISVIKVTNVINKNKKIEENDKENDEDNKDDVDENLEENKEVDSSDNAVEDEECDNDNNEDVIKEENLEENKE